jgi:hypothetical protein
MITHIAPSRYAQRLSSDFVQQPDIQPIAKSSTLHFREICVRCNRYILHVRQIQNRYANPTIEADFVDQALVNLTDIRERSLQATLIDAKAANVK